MEPYQSFFQTFYSRRGIHLDWNIRQFFHLSPDVGYRLSSSSFGWCNETWHFVMYPNGRNVEGCDPGYICIELRKSVSETPSRTPILLTLGIKVQKIMKEILLDQRFPTNDCDFWRADEFLQKTDELRRRVLQDPDGELTITFALRTEEALPKDGDSEMIERGKGSLLEEVCSSHKHGWWNFDYERLREYGVIESPSFKVDNQRYFLKLLTSLNVIYFKLFGKGPFDDRKLRWWGGVKHRDGSYQHWAVNRALPMIEECEFWIEIVDFGSVTLYNMEEYVATDRRITLFFRLGVERVATAERVCSHDAVERPVEGDGTIREDECPSHKHVEWYIDNEARLKVATSPEFVIGTQRYKLKLTLKCNGVRNQIPVSLHLISREPNVAGSFQAVRWCAGIIRRDGTSNYDNVFGKLDLKEECGIWTQKLLHEVSFKGFLNADGKFKIFFRMDDTTKLRTSTVCKHPHSFPAAMFQERHGSIEQDFCSHHCHVEWEYSEFQDLLSYSSLQRRWVIAMRPYMSPKFCIGAHKFKLQLKLVSSFLIELNLYIKRPPVCIDYSVRWWAGFKLANGTYLMNSSSGVLDPGDVHLIWTHRCLLTAQVNDIRSVVSPTNEFFTFFRINLDRAETEADSCLHILSEALPSQTETVLKLDVASHKEIELELRDPKSMDGNCWTLRSKEFAVGTQRFYFQLSCILHSGCPLLSLRLYSRGPAKTGLPPSARWCAGLKREDGKYYHRNMRGELDLKETCQLWTLRGSQEFVYSKCTKDPFLPGALFTVFFRISEEEQPSNAAVEYIPGIVEIPPTLHLGDIPREESASFTQVEWTTIYDPQKEKTWRMISPEFKIGTQLYILELSEDLNADNSIILCLYRRGASVTDPSGLLQWWTGLKRGNGSYHHRNQRGELDLKENCEIWTQVYLHRVCQCRLERELLTPDRHVTVFFRLSKEQESAACAHSSYVTQQDFKRLRREDNDDVVFSVKGEEFKMSRTIFQNQIPVFKSMFLHDTIEKRTGVASIEDVEPAIFKELLHYVSTGFTQKLNVHNACALYAVADKYLVEDLKSQLLQDVSEALSLQSFFDVVMLAVRYGEDDLMKEVINFLSGNKNIIETDAWQKFCSDKPEAADELQMEAFKHASVDSCHFKLDYNSECYEDY